MTRMTGPDCVVMCNLINTHTHTHTHTHGAYNEDNKRTRGQKGHHVTHLYACLDATQVSGRLAPVQDSSDSSTRRLLSLLSFYASVYDHSFPILVASLGEV